jgi:2-C-methyl-D-erythritol 2,4-cyclodiphosphate synthase
VKPVLVEGTRENIKITTQNDLEFAAHWLQSTMTNPKIRVGTGYDIHRMVLGRQLILGGVVIESEMGLLGHSDADVVLHAICDSLLGAAGLPDIGHFFPNDDPLYKDINSTLLLKHVHSKISEAGYSVGNVDCSIIAERPKIAPYIEQMRANIANALQVEPGVIGIKATTNEGLGSLGAGEGIACQAAAILYANDAET